MTRVPIPPEIKEEVFRKCHGECQMCGYMKDLEYHHIYPYRNCKSHESKNLILLCEDCHKLLAGDIYMIYDYQNRKGKITKIMRVMELHKRYYNERDPSLFLTQLSKWTRKTKNGCYKNGLIRIIRYLRLVNHRRFGLDIRVMKKGNGDLELTWTILE